MEGRQFKERVQGRKSKEYVGWMGKMCGVVVCFSVSLCCVCLNKGAREGNA